MKGLRIGRRRARTNELPSSPLERALRPALEEDRWRVPDDFNLTRDVVEVLAADPKRQALTFIGDDGIIEPRTFLEVAEGAALWAANLRDRGVRPEDRVLVLAGSGVGWLEVVLGVMKVGAVAVPCAPSLSAAALEVQVSSTEPALVVAHRSCASSIEQMSFAPDVHYLDEGRTRRDLPDESPTHDTSSRDLALILSTPGTAGASKTVAHTHGSVFAARVAAEHWLDARPGDVVWCTAESDSWLAASSTLAGPWSRGAEIVLQTGELSPKERLGLLFKLGPTILCQSPAEYRALAELPRLERSRPPRLRRLVSIGDSLEPEVVGVFEERWGLTIHDGYGQAETGVVVANGSGGDDRPGSIGHALPGQHVAIIDLDGDELPVGIEGDLAVRGRPPTLFAGYWESPEDTKSAFRGDWYLTGDVAVADEDGHLWFVARAEDVISSSGRTFGPHEVEQVLGSHGAVVTSAVVGMRDLQRGGQFVRAYVVPGPRAEGSEQLEAELRQFVGQTLREQQVPREIVFVDELPMVGTKVSRHLLRERPVVRRPLWESPAPTVEPTVGSQPVAPPGQPQPSPPAESVTPSPAAWETPAPAEPEPVVYQPTEAHEFTPLAEPVFFQEPVELSDVTPDVEPTVVQPHEPADVYGATPVAELPELVEPEAPEAPPWASEPAAPPVEPMVGAIPEPVAEADPVQVEPPGQTAGPELGVEALHESAAQPEPVVDLEPQSERAQEPMAFAAPEPATASEPVGVPDPSQSPETTHEPELAVPRPTAEAAPSPEPREPTPELTIVPSETEPTTERAPEQPQQVVAPSDTLEGSLAPEAAPPASEPVVDDVPLPDFVVTQPSVPPAPPPPAPEPEPEPELGPLPDFVIDPERPPEPRAPAPQPESAQSPPTPVPFGVERKAEPEPTSASAAGLHFPPVTSFPVPREDSDSDGRAPRDPRRTPRPRPTGDTGTGKRKGSAEPGDDGDEVGWMQGLSNRLSAYSLAAEEQYAAENESMTGESDEKEDEDG